MSEIATWSLQRRLEETLRKALPKLGPEARAQIEALITPQALAIVAGVLIAWVVSHAFGLGQIIDVIIVGVGVVSIGMAVFTGIDHLYDFAVGVYRARTEQDLERAAEEFAKAVAILGVQAVLAVLFRGAKVPRTGKGAPVHIERAPPPSPGGLRYRPRVKDDPTLPAGEGRTSFWGDIRISTHGSQTDRALALLHEKVHQFLTPKFYLLRGYRVTNRASSYVRSSLWRYIEEALAEVVAQVGVNGIRQFFVGVRFPVQNGYVYLTRGGAPAFLRMGGSGLVPESAALIYNGMVAGIAFEVRFQSTSPPTR